MLLETRIIGWYLIILVTSKAAIIAELSSRYLWLKYDLTSSEIRLVAYAVSYDLVLLAKNEWN
jgi:hypothetical protein